MLKIAVAFSILILLLLLTGCGAVGSANNPAPPLPSRLALVANSISNSISTYAIDSPTGRLSLKSTVPAGGTSPRVIAVEPSGRFAYVANTVSNDISVFAINTNTGTLSIWVRPFRPATGQNSSPWGLRETCSMW